MAQCNVMNLSTYCIQYAQVQLFPRLPPRAKGGSREIRLADLSRASPMSAEADISPTGETGESRKYAYTFPHETACGSLQGIAKSPYILGRTPGTAFYPLCKLYNDLS